MVLVFFNNGLVVVGVGFFLADGTSSLPAEVDFVMFFVDEGSGEGVFLLGDVSKEEGTELFFLSDLNWVFLKSTSISLNKNRL